MKKFIVIILILAAAGSGAWYVMQSKAGGKDLESVLPEDPLHYVQLNNAKNIVADVQKSQLWQNLIAIDYERVLGTTEQTSQIDALKNKLTEEIFTPTNKTLIEKFFGQEVIVAAYSKGMHLTDVAVTSPNFASDVVQQILSGVYIVTRLQPEAQIAELVARSFDEFGTDVQVDSEEYKDFTIQIVTVPQLPFKVAYVRIGDVLVITAGATSAQRSVDTYLKEKPSLAEDKEFQAAKTGSQPSADYFAYWNLDKSLDVIQEQIMTPVATLAGKNAQGSIDQVSEALDGLKGILDMMLSVKSGPVVKVKSIMRYDPNRMDTNLSEVYKNCMSIENQSIAFIPGEVLAYEWQSCFDLEYYWDELKEEFASKAEEGQPDFNDQVAAFETSMGLSVVNDILPAFGNEIGGYLNGIKMDGMFPLPELVLFLKVEDKAKMDRLLEKLFSLPYIMKQSTEYQGVSIRYVASPLGDTVQPSVCYLDDYLLIALNRKLIESSVDTKQSGNGLSQSPKFTSLDASMTEKSVNVAYLELEKSMTLIKELLVWMDRWTASRDQQKIAFQAGSKKRLDDTKHRMGMIEEQVAGINQQMTVKQDKIIDLENQGLDASEDQKELEAWGKDAEALKAQLAESQEEVEGLIPIVEGYTDKTVNPDQRKAVLDEIVNPILDGLAEYGLVGFRGTMSEKKMESWMYIK